MWRLQTAAGDHPDLVTLNGHVGRQTWVFDPQAGTPADRKAVEAARQSFGKDQAGTHHSSDLLLRLQALREGASPGESRRPEVAVPKLPKSLRDGGAVPPEVVQQAMRSGVAFYSTLQAPDGHWPGDYGGPMFLMPGLLITLHVTGAMDRVLTREHKAEMVRYLCNHANDDGGYGLHIEGHSTMFGTVLSYVSLRLLGVAANHATAKAAREWILSHGGATAVPSWGKFWLAVLGVYEWHGLNPMPPEMWLLPYALPVHPGRMWCHCRMVYLPMCYVYGIRGTGPASPLTEALKEELYCQPYGDIPWDSARSQCAAEDLYYPHPLVQDAIWWTLMRAEPLLLGSKLRKAALRKVMEHIHYEDENTRYVDIGPVNKVINMLCCWLEDPDGEAFKRHLPRVHDYLWLAEDGMKMQGYNGSQLWDTAFATQAILATGLAPEFVDTVRAAYGYIDASQVREDCAPPLAQFYRHISKGAWPFSTRDHGWPISDCTAEGLKAALRLVANPQAAALLTTGSGRSAAATIGDDRLFDAVNVILSFQNPGTGGWATYENTRSYAWLELLNPAETFGDIMIDYPYVECTSASIQALRLFAKAYPHHRTEEINTAISEGVHFILRSQRPDGSWYGSWGVCFTYGAWFGILGLVAAGQTWNGTGAIKRAVDFLLERQNPDGGWGESYLSCQDKMYSPLPDQESHCVNTAWAMLALLASGQAERDAAPLHRAAACLLRAQQDDGDWPQQHISGVFNRNCMITYANYRNIFPLWALGEYNTAMAALG